MAGGYYQTTKSIGFEPQDYYYDAQFRSYILQFMAIFAGLQVKIGKRKTSNILTQSASCDDPTQTIETPEVLEERLISVPIHYGQEDRVVAAILTENTQNKLLRLPAMSAYMRGLSIAENYLAGTQTEKRQSYLEMGGLIPEDIKVNYTRRGFPFRAEMEVGIYASNTDQHFQILEQILTIFDPIVQIQRTDAPFDAGKLTSVELKGISLDTNYPISTDRRIIQSTLTFDMVWYLLTPIDVRKNIVEKIFLRVGAVDNIAQSSEDIIAQLDELGITYDLISSSDDLSFK